MRAPCRNSALASPIFLVVAAPGVILSDGQFHVAAAQPSRACSASSRCSSHVIRVGRLSSPPYRHSTRGAAASYISEPLSDALSPQLSRHVRKAAIQCFGKGWRSAEWETVWSELGGIEGLLALFAKSGANDVKALSREIGRCRGLSRAGKEQRESAIIELLQGPLSAL